VTSGENLAATTTEDGWLLTLTASGMPQGATRADESVAAVGEGCRRLGHARVTPTSTPLAPVNRHRKRTAHLRQARNNRPTRSSATVEGPRDALC